MPFTYIQEGNCTIKVIQGSEPLDAINDNVDIIVEMASGEKYVGTLFTLDNIRFLMERYKNTGECNSGIYFWASDMVVVRDLEQTTIAQTIQSLIEDGEISTALSEVVEDDDLESGS